MHLPIISSASSAAGIAAQAASKDHAAGEAQASTTAAANPSDVEQSGEANADRDAQGQGDGLPNDQHRIVDENDIAATSETTDEVGNLPSLPPPEPPGHLDIIG